MEMVLGHGRCDLRPDAHNRMAICRIVSPRNARLVETELGGFARSPECVIYSAIWVVLDGQWHLTLYGDEHSCAVRTIAAHFGARVFHRPSGRQCLQTAVGR